MKRVKSLLFITICYLMSSFAFSSVRQGQELILPGHWTYDALISLELEMGRVTFGDQAPVSVSEMKSYLLDIDYERLSEVGKKQYDRVMGYLNEKNFSVDVSIFSLGLEPVFNAEGYYKSSNDTPWVYDYTKRQGLVELPIQFDVGDFLSMHMGLTGTQNYYTRKYRTDNYCNQIFTLNEFDPALVHESYLNVGYTWNNNVGLAFRLGSGTQSIGHSLMPSIIMSEYMTDTPYMNLRIFSPVFNYNMNITQLTSKTYFYSHRLEARFFKKISVSFMEGVLPYQEFDFRCINPFTVYHGFGLFNEYPEKCASFLGIKVSIAPVNYLRLYFLMAQNEHTMQSELDLHQNAYPEGNGFQAGIESYIPGKKGYFHVGAEFYYANSYMFIKENPNISFAKAFGEMAPGETNYYQWMGNPLGPDSLAFQVAFGYEEPQKWSCDLFYNFAACGEYSKEKLLRNSGWQYKNLDIYDASAWNYPSSYEDGLEARKKQAPHGTPEYVNSISIRGKYQILDWLSIMFQPSYTFIFNYDNQPNEFRQGIELALSVKIQFCKLPRNPLYSPNFLFKDGKEKGNEI